MNFNSRSELGARHAFLSPSSYHWINYDDQKLVARYHAHRAAKRGTDLHELAHLAIKLGVRMPRSKDTIAMYVNDGIKWGMSVEVCLYYSVNCFGHADSISFVQTVLRISDLKTGITSTSVHQLEVYAALFCLEYGRDPYELDGIELRIYQNDEVRLFHGDPHVIAGIMDKIVEFDARIEQLREEDER